MNIFGEIQHHNRETDYTFSEISKRINEAIKEELLSEQPELSLAENGIELETLSAARMRAVFEFFRDYDDLCGQLDYLEEKIRWRESAHTEGDEFDLF